MGRRLSRADLSRAPVAAAPMRPFSLDQAVDDGENGFHVAVDVEASCHMVFS